jgi:uncharacterized membrane protein
VLYLVLKWVHILAAVGLLGTHATYGIWIVRVSSHPEALPFTLRNIAFLDRWIALPAFVVLAITGFTMTMLAGIPLTTPWLLLALILFGVLVVSHLFGYRPTLHKLIQLAAEGPDSPNYLRSGSLEKNLGLALTAVMVAIAFLMVVKPTL